MGSANAQSEFRAFISYKHKVSSNFAEDFELDLKRYARSPLSKPPAIFRDEQHIKPGEDLTNTIRQALRDSGFLILLASPEAAESVWVQQELDYWCQELGRRDKLIIVLTAGTIALHSDGSEIDWKGTDALPQSLKEHLSGVPLYVDLSWAVTKKARSLDDPRYKTALNAVAARLAGVDPNVFLGQEWQLRRRALRTAWAVAIVLLALLIGTGTTAFFLNRSLRQSQSRMMAAQALLRSPAEALGLAAAAVETDENTESIRSILTIMDQNRRLAAHLCRGPFSIDSVVIENGGSVIHAAGEELGVVRWKQGEPAKTSKMEGRVSKLAQLADGRIVAAGSELLWHYPSGETIAEIQGTISSVESGSGSLLYVGLLNGQIHSVDVESGETRLVSTQNGMISGLCYVDPILVSAATTRIDPVVVIDTRTNQETALPNPPFSANDVDLSADAKTLAVAFEDGHAGVWNLDQMETPVRLKRLENSGASVAIHPDGVRIAFGTVAGAVAVVNTERGSLDQWQVSNEGSIWTMAWKGENLLTAGTDGWIREWYVADRSATGLVLPESQVVWWDRTSLLGAESGGWWIRDREGAIVHQSVPLGEVLAGGARRVAVKRADSVVVISLDSLATVEFPNPPAGRTPKLVEFSKDGSCLAICWTPDEREGNWVETIAIWRISSGQVTWIQSPPDFPKVLKFSDDMKLAMGGGNGGVAVWNENTGNELATHPDRWPSPIYALGFENEENLVIADFRGRVTVVACKDLDLPLRESEIPVGMSNAVTVSNDGQILCGDSDGVKWFTKDLAYLGPVAAGTARDLKVAPSGDAVAVHFGGVRALLIDLRMSDWIEKARTKATVGSRFEAESKRRGQDKLLDSG